MTMTINARQTLLLLFFLLSSSRISGTKHTFHNGGTERNLIGPVGVPFGFFAHGLYNITVLNFLLTPKRGESEDVLDRIEAGFLLKKFKNEAAYNQHIDYLMSNTSACLFEYFAAHEDEYMIDDDALFPAGEITSAENGVFLSMRPDKIDHSAKKASTIEYRFRPGEEGLYFLTYGICGSKNQSVSSQFDLIFRFSNVDTFGTESFLSAGEMRLPSMFFFFSCSYLLCFGIWVVNIREIQKGNKSLFKDAGDRPIIYDIHKLMAALILVKFLSVFFESIRYHVIEVSGHAEVWSVLYYAMSFARGFFLFTMILLIGTGWSFVKPFLHDREKKIIIVVLILQLINNVAIVVLQQETEGENSYKKWTGLLHLVDILCCCAVLLPIVWQVNELEKGIDVDDEEDGEEPAEATGEKEEILTKLKLFRTFYLVVVAYIYSTRILVYLFAALLNYKHLWVQSFVVEIVTLAFYVSVGLMFRPVSEASRRPNQNTTEEGVELLGKGN